MRPPAPPPRRSRVRWCWARPPAGAPRDAACCRNRSATGAQTSTAESAGALTPIYQDLGAQLSTQLQISSSAQLFVIIAVVLAMAAAVIVIVVSQRRPY